MSGKAGPPWTKPRTALDTPADRLDDHERNFVGNIREHGWFRTNVIGDDEIPGFAYTTGFWVSAQHPEAIIFSAKAAHDILWDVFRDAKRGQSLPIGKRTDAVFANLPAHVFPVAPKHYANLLGWSCWFYGGDNFPCLQIVWPDREARFPWEPDFDPAFEGDQLDLTERGWENEVLD